VWEAWLTLTRPLQRRFVTAVDLLNCSDAGHRPLLVVIVLASDQYRDGSETNSDHCK
jgi:hypothetical protein